MPTPVLVSFDTEDFISPPADDALLRLAKLLSAKGIRGSFNLVGEKARVLKARGRADVIEALRPHELCFHSRDHSIHPTLAPRCESLGWARGLEALRATELEAMAWVKDIFGGETLAAAVPPGSNVAPQAIWLYQRAGIPVYAGGFFGARDGKMYWYLGGLSVPYTIGADSVFARQGVDEVWERFGEQAGRPCAVLCIHPTITVHEVFWDRVNFDQGVNRPRGEWTPAPPRPPEQIEKLYGGLSAFLDRIAADPRFAWSDYATLLSEARKRRRAERVAAWPAETFAPLADGPDWVEVRGEGALSPQEALGELAARVTGDASWRERLSPRLLPGPVEAPLEVEREIRATREAVLRGLWRAQGALGAENTGLPARWRLGEQEVGPGKFLSALAQIALGKDGARVPAGVPETPASVARVGLDRWSYGAWLFAPGFEGRENLRLARRMAWTLCPA